MTLSALGIFSAAGAGGVVFDSDYELISSQILTGSQPTITFSSLGTYSSTYKHLQIRLVARNSGTANSPAGLWLRFNSDTGNNYAWHRLYANPSIVTDSGLSTNRILTGVAPSDGASSNVFGPNVFDLLDVYSGKNKVIRGYSFANTPTSNTLQYGSGIWFSSASVTSIDLTTDNNFMTGSRFSLYGIKG